MLYPKIYKNTFHLFISTYVEKCHRVPVVKRYVINSRVWRAQSTYITLRVIAESGAHIHVEKRLLLHLTGEESLPLIVRHVP
jgi:hypothetical protein